MVKNSKKNPYDPHLDSEKKVLAAKEALLNEVRGTDRIMRAGSQYFMSCKCGSLDVIDEDHGEVSQFMKDHDH